MQQTTKHDYDSAQYRVGMLDKMDLQDHNTPDDWIQRDPKLIRLTGRHPLNAEPPLTELMKDILTPSSIHYVRNHGVVPQLHWDTHKV
jgi:nitrate reductase (NAD(P)H)